MWALGERSQSSVWKRPRAGFDYPSSPLENRCSSVQTWTGQGGWVSRCALVWPRGTAETPTVSFTRSLLYKVARFTFSSLGDRLSMYQGQIFSLTFSRDSPKFLASVFFELPQRTTQTIFRYGMWEFLIYFWEDSIRTSGKAQVSRVHQENETHSAITTK